MHGLDRKYLFKGTLKLQTALHIGGGNANASYTDSPIIRTPEGMPFIPGSSLKGVFRSSVEKLALALNINTCQLIASDDDVIPEGHNNQEIDKKIQKIVNDSEECPTAIPRLFARYKADLFKESVSKGEGKLVDKLQKKLCATCKLFGSPYWASKITFHDLLMSAGQEAITQVRDGVVIDRDSERAVDKLKFDYEVVPPSSEFNLTIWLENPENFDLPLTCLGLSELISGAGHIGGKTTRGLGACTLENLQIYELDLESGVDREKRLRRYLLGKTAEEKMTLVDTTNFINEQIEKLI